VFIQDAATLLKTSKPQAGDSERKRREISVHAKAWQWVPIMADLLFIASGLQRAMQQGG
jgi:hypothetical protein